MKAPHRDPDVMLAADGHVYVNATMLPLADRAGRRVIRCLAPTPGEEQEIRRRSLCDLRSARGVKISNGSAVSRAPRSFWTILSRWLPHLTCAT